MCDSRTESDVMAMSSSDSSDPQVYLDGEGKPRRRPGRPRKDPRGTQAELKAKAAAEKRERESAEGVAKAALIEANRAYIQSYVGAIFSENKVAIGDLLVGILEYSIEVCGSADLTMEPAEVRAVAVKTMTDEIHKLISPNGVIEWQAQKLRERMIQGLAAPVPVPSQMPRELEPPSMGAEVDEIDIQALMEGGLPGCDD
ncbi:hypothetical protein AB0F25_30440 [Streptomyces wedmorensis]|uniref:hypothetical protein n=1 Tax=Streptomyces wedmorensis TaxID=43759 RepID=UPI00344549EB